MTQKYQEKERGECLLALDVLRPSGFRTLDESLPLQATPLRLARSQRTCVVASWVRTCYTSQAPLQVVARHKLE